MAYRVSKERFGELVEEALEEIPPPFDDYLAEVVVEVRDRPTAKQMKSVGTRRGDLLLGLYHGRPRTHRSVLDHAALPDIIYIFQESVEIICRDEDELVEQIRKTVLHEIGHHFGMSEEDLDDLGYG